MNCLWCSKRIPLGQHHLVRYCSPNCRYDATRRRNNELKRARYHEPSYVLRPANLDPVEIVLARGKNPGECKHRAGFVFDMCRGCLLMSDEIREISRRRLLAP